MKWTSINDNPWLWEVGLEVSLWYTGNLTNGVWKISLWDWPRYEPTIYTDPDNPPFAYAEGIVELSK